MVAIGSRGNRLGRSRDVSGRVRTPIEGRRALKGYGDRVDAWSVDSLDQILGQVRPYNHADRPTGGKAALLVIDMQEYFSDIAMPIVPRVADLIAAARAARRPVVFTRHGHRDLPVDGGELAAWWGDHLPMVGTPQWEIIDAVGPKADEAVIDKTHYSAFFKTGLHALLEAAGVREVIICGVMTNCCCETTARDAFMREYPVFVAADATATANSDLHVSSLKGMAYACASILGAADLASSFETA